VFTLILSLLLAVVVLAVLVFLTRHRATRKPCTGARAREARALLLSEVASNVRSFTISVLSNPNYNL
jgi:hypothetical protein